MRKHAIRVLVLVLAFAFVGGSVCQAAPVNDTRVSARSDARVGQEHRRLTGFGGMLESRLETLLRWVRDVFRDDAPITSRGLTDDPDPTTDEFDPDKPVDEENPIPDQDDGEMQEDGGPFIPAARKS